MSSEEVALSARLSGECIVPGSTVVFSVLQDPMIGVEVDVDVSEVRQTEKISQPNSFRGLMRMVGTEASYLVKGKLQSGGTYKLSANFESWNGIFRQFLAQEKAQS